MTDNNQENTNPSDGGSQSNYSRYQPQSGQADEQSRYAPQGSQPQESSQGNSVSSGQPIYQGQPMGGQAAFQYPQVETYLVYNIVAMMIGFVTCWICCIGGFVGLVGVIFSTQGNSRLLRGDTEGAKNDSRVAKILMIVSFVITIIAFIYLIFKVIRMFSTGEIETVREQINSILEQGGYY